MYYFGYAETFTIPSDRSGMVAICVARQPPSGPEVKMGCVELCNFHFCCASIFCQPRKKFEFFGATRATRQRHSKRVALGTRMGEKSTKYFVNLEKRNHIKKHIRKLHISGVINTDPFCILKEQERFYKNLYKRSSTDPDIALKISSFLNDLNIPTLSEDQKNICEGKISAEECYRLLDSFDNNKTPGNDGIPIEF